MHVNRFIVIVLDSVGIGEATDAASYGDTGSHTLGNTARVVGGLQLPHMEKMGLSNIALIDGLLIAAMFAPPVVAALLLIKCVKDTPRYRPEPVRQSVRIEPEGRLVEEPPGHDVRRVAS